MFALMGVLVLVGDDGFFEGKPVRFWSPVPSAGLQAEPLWADSDAPAPVRRLLDAPTPDHARAYVEWQNGRLRSLRAAMAAIGEAGEILYFSRPGCGYCLLQDRELEGLAVRRVPPGSPLWGEHGVEVTPTLVIRGRTFRGLTPRARIVEALNRD